MSEEKLENKIAFQIGFLIHSGKNPNDVIRDLKLIALEYAEQFKEKSSNEESCAGCRFYNSCGLRIDYDNVRCPDFLS